MKLTDLMDEKMILPELAGRTKTEVLQEFADLLAGEGKVRNGREFLEVILAREALGSTGIGDGIAIPHGKLKDLQELVLAFGLSRQGVEFDAMDGKPVHLFFVLVAPEDSPGDHLKALARISRLVKNKAFRDRLLQSRSAAEIYAAIREEDEQYGP